MGDCGRRLRFQAGLPRQKWNAGPADTAPTVPGPRFLGCADAATALSVRSTSANARNLYVGREDRRLPKSRLPQPRRTRVVAPANTNVLIKAESAYDLVRDCVGDTRA